SKRALFATAASSGRGARRDGVRKDLPDTDQAGAAQEVMMRKTIGLALAALAACALLAGCASDQVIEAKVKSKLAADDTVKAAQITVTAKEHVVTLTGNVDSEAAKEKAMQLARETSGVTTV